MRLPVAISGIGCLCAAGTNLGECMESLFRGFRSPAPPSRFKSSHKAPYPVFEIPETAIPDDLREATHISLTGRLALAAAREALDGAGIGRDEIKGQKVGVCVGTTVGSAMNDEAFYAEFRKGGNPGMTPIIRFLRSNPAAVIAREFGLTGPCQTVVNACTSGTDAVGIGASWVQSGLCSMVIAGGADELCHVTYNGFVSLMITDEAPCKPFDKERRGLNLGEGAAMLLLESERSLLGRGASSRPRFLGYASSIDAYHLTAPHPDGAGLKRALLEALRYSEKDPPGIAFVNAHGTATPDNDRVEAKVLREILPGVPFFSTKGYTGHTLGAAGAIEAAFTAACLERGLIPGNVGFETPDPDLGASPVVSTTVLSGDAAISQSLAFGGSNAVVVLGRSRG